MVPKRWFRMCEKGRPGLTGPRKRYLLSTTRNKVVVGGRRSLKTEIAKRLLVNAAGEKREYPMKFFYGAPTQDQALRIAWKDLCDLMPVLWVDNISETDAVITTIDGNEIYVVGLNTPERLEGIEFDGGIMDERADMKEKIWEKNIWPMLLPRDGWSIHLGVPDYEGPSSQEFKEMFEHALLGTDPLWEAFHWPSSDVIPDEKLDQLRDKYTPELFDQEFNATFLTAQGVAYNHFQLGTHVVETPFIPGQQIHISCDFNFGHHNWGLYQVEHNVFHPNDRVLEPRTVYRIVEDVYLPNATVEMMCHKLESQLKAHGIDVHALPYGMLHFYGDNSGNSQKAEATDTAWNQIKSFFRNGIRHDEPQGPINDRINNVNTFFRNAKGLVSVRIDPKARNHVRDFERVTRKMLFSKQKTGELTHASDAFGYFINQFSGIEKLRNTNTDNLSSMIF